MKATSAMFLATAGASIAVASPTPQAPSTTDVAQSFQCPGPDGHFCVGDAGANIIACTAGIPGPVTDCCEHTASQPPLGSLEGSCYQSSPVSGDAVCTKSCVAYPLTGGASYPVPGECTPSEATPVEAVPSTFPSDQAPPISPEAVAPPTYPSDAAPPTLSSAEAPPTYPSTEAPPAEAPEAPEAAPTEAMPSMPSDFKPPFPFHFSGPIFNMTFPAPMPSSSVEAPPEDAPSTMPMPYLPPPKPLVEVSSEPAPVVFTKPIVEVPSAPPTLEVPAPTPPAPAPEIPSAPPAVAPPALPSKAMPPAMPSPPAPLPPAPPALPTSIAASPAPPAFSLPPFLSHIIGNWAQPPASSIPLPTTDVIATTTIPMTQVTHSYASPAFEGPGAPWTFTRPSDFSALSSATLPPYVTTVTVGTKTQYHTIFSDCGNGTMIFGSSTIALPTGSAPNEVPAWMSSGSYPPLPTITTVPCSEATGWNNTSLYSSKTSSKSYSYIATLPASATPSHANSLFSQGDGFDGSSSGSKSVGQISGCLVLGFVVGIAAMAL